MNILMMCLALGYPMGMCNTLEQPIEVPEWATEEWIMFASHIVASEARGVPVADKVIACTMIRDIERGWHPWRLTDRWFGWGTPDKKDIEAVRDALINCDDIPDYKFVGNIRDVQLWLNRGMINNGKHDLYIGYKGQMVIGIRWNNGGE